MFERVPEELKDLPQWVCHCYPNKAPLSPFLNKAGKLFPASCSKIATWGSFKQVVEAVEKGFAVGIGFEFANGICGVDIDHCVTDGELSPLAKEILNLLGSYAEFSPSGAGLHILCKGSLPPGGRKNTALGLEMYDRNRYFTITGNVCCDDQGLPYPLRDCTALLAQLHRKYMRADEAAAPPPDKPQAEAGVQGAASVPQSSASGRLSDEALLEKAFRAKGGEALRALYHGDWSNQQYPSQSEADFALCNHLAFWCGGDAARIDRLFRASGLYRPKWDQKHGARTYGEYTVSRALQGRTEVYSPASQAKQYAPPLPDAPPPGPKDPAAPPSSPPNDDRLIDSLLYNEDDTGNAHLFRDVHYRELKYSYEEKGWFHWTGRFWERDLTGIEGRAADALLEKMRHDIHESSLHETGKQLREKFVRRSSSSRAKEAMIREAQHLDGMHIMLEDFDQDPNLLNVQNGVLDLRTGKLQPHRPELMCSMIAGAAYNPHASCPSWMRFLHEVTCEDTELQLYLQRMAGYCLTGLTREQCIFFFYGDGLNGKSTMLTVLQSLVNTYGKNCQPETLMYKDRGNTAARSDLIRLKDARLVTTAESNDGCRLDEAVVKQMTGNDIITARMLYRAEVDFRPKFKIIMGTNYKPTITGSDNGIWRRIRLIPFNMKLSEDRKDGQLDEKLLTEKEGVLRWAVQGAMDWYKYGMPTCGAVDYTNNKYRHEMDKVKQFLDDCVIRANGSTLQASTMYRAYRAWCAQNGERYPMTNTRFSIELQDKRGIPKQKTSQYNRYLDVEFTEMGRSLADPAAPRFT